MAATAPDPTASVSTETQPDGPSTVLDVNVELGESDDSILGERLLTEATSALAAEHVQVVQGAAPSKVSVELTWDADDNHVITIRVTNRGEATQSIEGSPFVCEGCNENDIIVMLHELVPGCVPLLPGPEVGDGVPDDGGAPGDGGDKHGYRKIGGAGIAGIVLMAGGVGLTAFGGVELARGEVTNSRSDAEQTKLTDHRPRGIIFLAAGSTAVIAGAVLLAVDLTVLKNKRKRRSARIAPIVTPQVVGLGLSGRF